jgi:hypothetical protein
LRSHAKASTAGSNQRQAKGLGRIFRGAGAGRGSSLDCRGSGAPSCRRAPLLVVAALASLFLIALAAAPAFAAEPEFEFVKAFGPDGTNASGFASGGSVAVDQTAGLVYVLDVEANALFKYDLEGNPVDFGGSGPNISGNELSGLAVGGGFGDRQVAVDSESHTVYLTAGVVHDPSGSRRATALEAFQPNGEPSLFTAGPGAGTNEITGFYALRGVAVDSNGSIYLTGVEESVIGDDVSIYNASGELVVPSAGVTFPGNVAVDSNGVLYAQINNAMVTRYTPSEYPVTAATTYAQSPQSVDPNRALSVAVDPATNDVYVAESDPAPRIAVYNESGALLTTFGGPGEEGQLNGFAVGIAVESEGQERVFVSEFPESGLRQVKTFKRLEAEPTIDSTSVSDVSADSATLGARINPRSSATSYRFEYGLADCSLGGCTSVPLGGAAIGAGHKLVAVSQQLFGLQAATIYHYRVIAQNAVDTVVGPDLTFTTQLRGLGFQLADRRAWEMVSPPKKYGGKIGILSLSLLQAAADGNALAYPNRDGSLDADPEGNRAFEESTNLARRGGDGWHSKDITPPHTTVTGVQAHSEYRVFTPDLSEALVEPSDSTPLSPMASEQTIYLRENTEPPTYTPLVTGKEGFANVPPGTVFGQGETVGANSTLTHVVVSREAGLPPGAPPRSLYEWSGGQLQLIDRLPAGEGGGVPPSAVLGSGRGSVRHAISEDGSRVFWSISDDDAGYNAAGINLTALYARDTEAEESVRLDLPQPGASEAGEVKPGFQGASADGAVVFFTDSQQLTADASPAGRDLYRCVVSFSEATPGCASLTDISAPLLGSGESAEVQDMSPAFSDDGTHFYFVARGVLDTVPNAASEGAVAGEPNLYLWREGQGVRFIAPLSDGDSADWGKVGINPVGWASNINAAASPSGRYFTFMSERSLTTYDNRDAASGEGVEEVYRYDAIADRVECISCNPSGASPFGGRESSSLGLRTLADPHSFWRGRRVAAILPEPLRSEPFGNGSLYRPRAIFDSGRVFFNAIDALVPADSNGQWDVYQYEPLGVGDCTASSGSASISRSGGGCIGLISSGTAEEEAAFLDASATGDDVFFLTPAQLSVTDEDHVVDVYDARVDGVPATLAPNNECLGEACQPAAIAPNDPTPASSSFRGRGNVKPNVRKRCAKGKRKVRRGGKARCVSDKHKRHHRAGKSRRAGR